MHTKLYFEMDSKCIVNIIFKNKLNITIILALAILCSIFFSSNIFIKPLYKSTVILYPTTTYSVSKAIMNTNNLIYVDPLEIGEEAQTEQMIQILHSSAIRDKIIERYDLINHYGIKEDSKYKLSKLINAYENKIKIRRTEYNSVKIIVFDTDPQIAADIANDIAILFDETMNNMQIEISAKALAIIENEYNNTKEDIKTLEDSLKYFFDNGIYNTDIQLNAIYQQLAVEIAKGNDKGAKNLEKEIGKISENGQLLNEIKNEIETKTSYLSLLKTKYDDARINATETIPHKFVITSAYASDKPAYPIRWVIVLVTFFATFVCVVFVLATFEYKENKNNKQDE